MTNKMPRGISLSYEIENAETASITTVNAVAAVSDTPIPDLDPLIGTIDPDALDTLIDESSEAYVSFQYCGFDIAVHAGEVVIKE